MVMYILAWRDKVNKDIHEIAKGYFDEDMARCELKRMREKEPEFLWYIINLYVEED